MANSVIPARTFLTHRPGRIPDRAVVPNVGLPDRITPPKSGLTLIRGDRISTTEVSRQHILASQNNQALLTIKVSIFAGNLPVHRITLDDLPGLKVLVIDRITGPVGALITDAWDAWPERPKREAAQPKPSALIMSRPRFLDFLIEQPDFRHLSAIAYRTGRAGEPALSVITVFKASSIISMGAPGVHIELELPSALSASGMPEISRMPEPQ